MNITVLTNDERELLRGHFSKSPISLVRLKAQAILMRNEGLKQSLVAKFVVRSERTIQRWVRDFSKRRMASIFSGHKDNENASKLTRAQKSEISKVLKQPPSEYGIPKDFWDVPALRDYICAEFGTVYESTQSYHYLLKFSNLSFHYPARFDVRRNEKEIQTRMSELRGEVAPFLKDPLWEVFTSDETRIELEALTRRAWLQKGKKTVLKVDRKKESQNYMGFLSQKDFRCHVYELPWQNQDEILRTFRSFLKKFPDKQICIVWDNASFHKGRKIRKALEKGGLLERVHLINLPPYAPDMNPIEHVWGWVKDQLSNKQFQDFDLTKRQFRKFTRSRQFEYGL